MRALVVGAGAVGQVFGAHLARGGARVTFLVKDRYVEECRRGFTLYPLERRDGGAALRLEGCEVVTDAGGGAWDQVYLTVASNALRGAWLPELARATGEATIVKLQPGLADRAHLAQHVAPRRIVDGEIHFLSYHAPLPGETRFAEPGMAYWPFPGKAKFSGDDPARVAAVVEALEAGGMPAKAVKDLPGTQAFPAAILAAFIAALEAAGWSFARMRSDGLVTLAARAAREAIAVAGREVDARVPVAMKLAASPAAFRAVLGLGPKVVPVDLETYLKVHFTKVGEQMHGSLALYLERARAMGIAVPALGELAERVIAAPI